MSSLDIGNPHARETVRKRDPDFRRFLRTGEDQESPVGISYSDLNRIYKSLSFRRFEKSNKDRRGKMFMSGAIDETYIWALRHARTLLGRRNCPIIDIEDPKFLRNAALKPLLKWRGGKSSDLKHLRSNFAEIFPQEAERYFEPFLGGGAVWLSIKTDRSMFVNDICQDLIDFYIYIRSENNDFFESLTKMGIAWDMLRVIAEADHDHLYAGKVDVLEKYKSKFKDISFSENCYLSIVRSVSAKAKKFKQLDEKNKVVPNRESKTNNSEGAMKAGYYTYIRDVFNKYITKDKSDPLKIACFYFLRDYSFSAMFRYNSEGLYNVPYGGIGYNARSPAARVGYWKSSALRSHLEKTIFDNEDFEEFLDKHQPNEKDFIFIDPPYDTEFSTYDKKEFGKDDQGRLAQYLIHKTKCPFVAVMKNTDYIFSLYDGHSEENIQYIVFDKKYQVNIKNRNDVNVQHLVAYRTSPVQD